MSQLISFLFSFQRQSYREGGYGEGVVAGEGGDQLAVYVYFHFHGLSSLPLVYLSALITAALQYLL